MKQMDVVLDPMAGTEFVPGRTVGTFAIDPGPEQSGWCVLAGGRVLASGVLTNAEMLERVASRKYATMAIEMIASYGMAVGREVFETCVWIGRFMQAWHDPESVQLVYRKQVTMHLCGTTKANDSNVRRAILDLFPRTGGGSTPQIGTKKKPGPLYGVTSHAWPAIGVALTVQAQQGARA